MAEVQFQEISRPGFPVEQQYFSTAAPFLTERGELFPSLRLAYKTYGNLTPAKDNVIWVCHALTANADVASWWPGLFGGNRVLDPSRYFIVCVNMPGSCYGSSTPADYPHPGDFPQLTIRDMAAVNRLLMQELGISNVKLLLGASMGGHQALELAYLLGNAVQHLVLIATSAVLSPWARAFNETQLMALESDPDFRRGKRPTGTHALAAARAMAMLSYRSYNSYNTAQSELNDEGFEYRAASYQRYQGQKLVERFDPYSYRVLLEAMNSHNIGRGRGGVQQALSEIPSNALVLGISSDILFPLQEQEWLAAHLPKARLALVQSQHGHDGFLLETQQIQSLILQFLRS